MYQFKWHILHTQTEGVSFLSSDELFYEYHNKSFPCGAYRASLSIIRIFLPPKLASEVPSVLYLALELFGEKNRYPRKPMTLPFFIKLSHKT